MRTGWHEPESHPILITQSLPRPVKMPSIDAAGDDLLILIWMLPLQLNTLFRRHGHQISTSSRRQDHGHRFQMDGADFGARLRHQSRVEIVGGLALLDGCPLDPGRKGRFDFSLV